MSDPNKRSEEAIQAFNEGFDARHHGGFIWECPYDMHDPLGDEWRDGFTYYEDMAWKEAQMHQQDEILDDPRHGQAKDINSGRY